MYRMRKRLYSIIEPAGSGDKFSSIYDFIMMITIVISIVPLAFKETRNRKGRKINNTL